MDKTLQWLQEISEAPGVSGFEGKVKALLTAKLGNIAEVSHDKIGSVIFRKAGSQPGPKIMLASHMDEIGFMVKSITKEGFLKFATLGGWWEQVMLGQRVTVFTSRGELPGVIGSKPPHILTPEERKKVVQKREMFIDVGAAGEAEAKESFGIRPGDPIVPSSTFAVMANEKYLMSKAWDNRIGCAVMADVMEKLQYELHPNVVFGVGTVQEEVGLRGAQTSVSTVNPDIAFAVDTCIAGDTPGITEDQAASKLGKGVAISIYDSSMVPHTKLRNFVIRVAEENHIPFQLDFMEGGGTDAGKIHVHSQGVPSLVLSIPTRYIHSHNSVIHRDDYEAAVQLLLGVVKKVDESVYKELTEN
ncbi:peptidase m42 [Lucifera butyrica]|uniref:Peptidase m42 n=1 Tax=Lucifera butyrica TaxID=1351585 RepID=A0A498R969_9FIRM|nr:M42 family metallopeptidase [Lucifera butyrica]VBB05678.1 peptidase m42 [Lucifera butyrica]